MPVQEQMYGACYGAENINVRRNANLGEVSGGKHTIGDRMSDSALKGSL